VTFVADGAWRPRRTGKGKAGGGVLVSDLLGGERAHTECERGMEVGRKI